MPNAFRTPHGRSAGADFEGVETGSGPRRPGSSRRVERHLARPGLPIGEGVGVHLGPARGEDFVLPAPGEEEQPDDVSLLAGGSRAAGVAVERAVKPLDFLARERTRRWRRGTPCAPHRRFGSHRRFAPQRHRARCASTGRRSYVCARARRSSRRRDAPAPCPSLRPLVGVDVDATSASAVASGGAPDISYHLPAS